MSDLRKRHKTKVPHDIAKHADNTEGDEKKPSQQSIPLRVLTRIVVITSLLIIVWFSSNEEKAKTFAKQSDIFEQKGLIVKCAPEYRKEITEYDGCMPRECGRFVLDKIVTLREADVLLEIAKKGLKLGESSGGASILDLHSGALSFKDKFVNIYKLDDAKNIFEDKDFTVYRVVKDKIKYAIANHFGIDPAKLYLTHPTFFSYITSKPAVTLHDEYWHPHVDKETYKSFHYTSLLYLSDYGIDFKGGRFVFIDGNVNSTIEPRKSRVSMFTSGAENLHFVEKVIFGKRYAMTISFTCDSNYAISDPGLSKFNN